MDSGYPLAIFGTYGKLGVVTVQRRASAFFGISALPSNKHTYTYIYTSIVLAGAIIVSSGGEIRVA